ncbi:hypothetical protein BSL78_17887 [Apostichopus japonicus]|uniref:Uncharacterized protein n=1 Tax=Stichopus japonicus TaxID=307972 RepID=A0A2G8KB95_STIJA|nr:hypothetical protein BSL78_17887 [Apostichopus japonicus]
MVSEVVQHRPQNEGNLDQPEAKRARLDTLLTMTISSIFNACYSGSVIDTPEEETLLDSVVEPFLAGDTGPALPPKIADFIARMMTEKLSDDKLNEKVRAYKQPENCDILQPTRINQIIWDKIKPGTRSKDIKVQKAQSVLVKSMTALVVTIKDFLEGRPQKEVHGLFDTLALLAQGNLQLNLARRELIKADLSRDFATLCSQNVPVTKFLFGDDISKELKDIVNANKMAAKVMPKYGRVLVGAEEASEEEAIFARGRSSGRSPGPYGRSGRRT